MILIADSGSTKTDWRVITADGKIQQFKTPGINPYHQSKEEIIKLLQTHLLPQIDDTIEAINFYGAGCSVPSMVALLKGAISEVISNADVNIFHDLLGAARSLCGHQPGIACILGTGSNSCSYDGVDIVDNISSLGYILGDEGSGSWLGKRLINDYFGRDLPTTAKKLLEDKLEMNRAEILENVYKKPLAGKYLAGFSPIISDNISDPYFYNIVHEGFSLFFEKNIKKYKNFEKMPVHFTGSIAFYYSNILRQVASEQNVFVKNIAESPIAGLTLYHK
ncbi:MAG TPA: N-acetylglucosamine kinase [Fulvivirga sp.]|nr:N-acetylglucosamine kinase [Fulvivirga sp.]